MKVRKTLYWVDRIWYDAEDNRIVGDMGFSFCDADNTRTDKLAGFDNTPLYADEMVISGESHYANKEGDDIEIYEVYKGIFEDEVEEGDEFCDWSAELTDEVYEVVKTFAICSKEYADKVGLEEILDGAKIIYCGELGYETLKDNEKIVVA